MDDGHGVERLGLLASAIAACEVRVSATAADDDLAWTDGATVFIDAANEPASQVRALAVQASLLAAGSVAPDVGRRLGTNRNTTRRYLAVEGHRALAQNEANLPWSMRSIID